MPVFGLAGLGCAAVPEVNLRQSLDRQSTRSMPVCTLSDLRKEDEQRTRDMERGETSPLLRGKQAAATVGWVLWHLSTYVIK